MEYIQIKAEAFFEMIKIRDISMWDIFAQMIDGNTKTILFTDETENPIFDYLLPSNLDQLKIDQAQFAKEFSQKLAQSQNNK